MSDIASAAIPIDVLKPLQPQVTNASGRNEADTRAKIGKTASDFEAQFLSVMLGQMFDGVETTTFGGGAGEAAFKSFMTDAMARSMAKHGGVGLSKSLTAEMLKMQGLHA